MEYNELLLRTAFACMACDGEIVPEEVRLIKDYANNANFFGDVIIDEELQSLEKEINHNGKRFLKEYLLSLYEANLSEEQELQLLKLALNMILKDNVIEYSEIKFFKVIRSNLKVVSNETIMQRVEGITEDFLAEDIKSDYLDLYNDYFENIEIPEFKLDTITDAN